MQKIYDFTNENVGAFKSLFDFSNAHVLTVLGSGDQYFTSLLNGAKILKFLIIILLLGIIFY